MKPQTVITFCGFFKIAIRHCRSCGAGSLDPARESSCPCATAIPIEDQHFQSPCLLE